MNKLAETFNVNMREIRKIIETLKLKQVAKIGTLNGYYIMSIDEYQKELNAAKLRIEKSIIVFESQFPEEKNFLHAVVHRNKKRMACDRPNANSIHRARTCVRKTICRRL